MKASQIVNEIEDLTEEERDLILGGSLEKMFRIASIKFLSQKDDLYYYVT